MMGRLVNEEKRRPFFGHISGAAHRICDFEECNIGVVRTIEIGWVPQTSFGYPTDCAFCYVGFYISDHINKNNCSNFQAN